MKRTRKLWQGIAYVVSMGLPARDDGQTDIASDESDDGQDIGLRERWQSRYVRRIDGETADILERYRTGRWAVVIRPPEEADEDPEMPAKRLFETLHGEFPRCSLEIAEVEDQIVYRAVVFDPSDAEKMLNRIMSLTECDAEIVEKPALPGDSGDFAAVSKIEYEKDHLLPARHHESDEKEPYQALLDTISGEWDGQTAVQIISEPVGDWSRRTARGEPIHGRDVREHHAASVVLAAMATVATYCWWIIDSSKWSVVGVHPDPFVTIGRIVLSVLAVIVVVGVWLAEFPFLGCGLFPRSVDAKKTAEWIRDDPWRDVSASKEEKQEANVIARQDGSPGFRTSIRVLTTADNRMTAHRYHRRVCRSLRNAWHNRATGQRLVDEPVGWPRPRTFRKMMKKIAKRKPDRDRRQRWADKIYMRPVRRFPTFMSDFELASLAHWPDRSAGGASMIEYAKGETDEPSARADDFGGIDVGDIPKINGQDAWDEAAIGQNDERTTSESRSNNERTARERRQRDRGN